MRKFYRAFACVVVSAVVFAGCAAIPRSGEVQLSDVSASEPAEPPVDFIAEGPSSGATQMDIARGFIEASSSTRDSFSVAREYLTPTFARMWQPDSNVIIDAGARTYSSSDAGGVLMAFTQVASVDAAGNYQEESPNLSSELNLEFEQVNGEWRISAGVDGLVIDSSNFTDIFQQHALTFLSQQGVQSNRYLVPDIRWFVTRTSTPTAIVTALLDGPSEWLRDVVATGFPNDAVLESATVPVVDGVATVSITTESGVAETDVILAQLSNSLAEVQGVSGVELRVNQIDITPSTPDIASYVADSRPLVLANGEFGFLVDGATIERIQLVSDAVESVEGATAVAVSGNYRTVAIKSQRGIIISRDGSSEFVRQGEELVQPTVDNEGYVWTTDPNQTSLVSVWAPSGGVFTVDLPDDSNYQRLEQIEISHDGSRMLMLFRTESNSSALIVTGIKRSQGSMMSMGEALELRTGTGTPIDSTWIDDRTIATLTSGDDGNVVTTVQVIGGQSSQTQGPSGAKTISGGSGTNQLRALTDDGALLERQNSVWQTLAVRTDISVLATQMGMPTASTNQGN